MNPISIYMQQSYFDLLVALAGSSIRTQALEQCHLENLSRLSTSDVVAVEGLWYLEFAAAFPFTEPSGSHPQSILRDRNLIANWGGLLCVHAYIGFCAFSEAGKTQH